MICIIYLFFISTSD